MADRYLTLSRYGGSQFGSVLSNAFMAAISACPVKPDWSDNAGCKGDECTSECTDAVPATLDAFYSAATEEGVEFRRSPWAGGWLTALGVSTWSFTGRTGCSVTPMVRGNGCRPRGWVPR